jgi:surfeit locus 1 family protein
VARRHLLFLFVAVVAASVCARLGFWQLSRLSERRARNALVAARLALPTVSPAELPRDTGLARFRRVTLRGEYDYAHEIVLTNRAREGSPGVYIVTPLRIPGSDTAVLVTRGWVYSPDAATVDLARWREHSDSALTGFVVPFPSGRRGSPTLARRPGALRWLTQDEVSRRTGYPVAPYTVVLLGGSRGGGDSVPPRIAPPPLDEGPHLNYAFQWFSFGAIALVGAAIFLSSERRKRGPDERGNDKSSRG